MPTDEEMQNAIRAGWNPDDGDPPNQHGEFQEGLEASDSVEALIPKQERGNA